MTVYSLHTLTGVLGPAKAVTAMSGVRIKEREFRGQRYPCDAHDNSFLLLDFGDSIFAFVYGAAAGTVLRAFSAPSFFGTKGSIQGKEINGKPIDYPGREEALRLPGGDQSILPHVKGAHQGKGEEHVFEDIMQLVDLVRQGTPTPSTPEHARHVIEIIEACYLSAESGQRHTLRTTFEQI
jgi:predicted dehydrogenase